MWVKFEYHIKQYDMSIHLARYISASPKWILRNNIDVIDYFAGGNEIHE